MFENLEDFYGAHFNQNGIKFNISLEGMVTCAGGMKLGHIEDCIDEGEIVRQLIDLLDDIELPKNI